MKILALCDYQCDFLAHGILAGLWESGHDIYEIPVLKSVRGGIDEEYFLPDKSRGCSGTPSYLLPNPLPLQTHTKEEIFDNFKDFDLVIMLSGRDYVRYAAEDIRKNTGISYEQWPLICLDGEDHDGLDRSLINYFTPKALFKRELLRKHDLMTYSNYCGIPVWPLPFSAFARSLPEVDDTQKFFDIFLSLGRTYSTRDVLIGTFLDVAVQQKLTHWIGTNSNSPLFQTHPHGRLLHDLLLWQDYMGYQAHSKITASIRGFGRDALHAYEAFSFATCVLYCDPGIYIPHPFIDRQHCIYFNEDCQDVPEKLHWLLADDGYRKDIAAAGKRHCHEFHTTKARVKYLLSLSTKIRDREKIYPEEFGLC